MKESNLEHELSSSFTLERPKSKFIDSNSPDSHLVSFLSQKTEHHFGTIFRRNAILTIHSPSQQTTFMTEQQKLALEEAIAALKGKLTGDMFADMDTRDEIHNLEMQLKGVKPIDSHFDCIGCGS